MVDLTIIFRARADLSNATLYQNTELQTRVAELEAELTAVKKAYTTATDIAALEQKAHNAQLSSLNRQISTISCSQVCVQSYSTAAPPGHLYTAYNLLTGPGPPCTMRD